MQKRTIIKITPAVARTYNLPIQTFGRAAAYALAHKQTLAGNDVAVIPCKGHNIRIPWSAVVETPNHPSRSE